MVLDADKCAEFMKTIGMGDEDIRKQTIILTRGEGKRGAMYNLGSSTVTVYTENIYRHFGGYYELAIEIVEGRRKPKKNQFNQFLYTRKLPEYLASAPSGRALAFSHKLLDNALAREINGSLLHEEKHAADSKKKHMRYLHYGSGVGWLAWSLVMAGFSATALRDNQILVDSDEVMLGTFALGVVAYSSFASWVSKYVGDVVDPMEFSASKLQEQLKNHPEWRNIVSFKPKRNFLET